MRRRTQILLLACLLIGLMIFPSAVMAVEDTLGIEVTIGELFYISVDEDELTWEDFEITYLEYNESQTQSKPLTIFLRTNAGWRLYIHGAAATWDTDPNPTWDKPVGDILWKNDGETYVPLTTGMVQAHMGINHKPSGIGPGMNIRIKLDWGNDVPGYYHYTGVVLTVTAD